jgi:hypothetical protein
MEKEKLLDHFNLTQIPFAGDMAETPDDTTSPDENPDEKKTQIREMMVIKYVFGFFAGTAFNSQPNTDAFEAYIKSN